ncbi:MAG: MBL fold metallo-hydrolase [Bacillota bacterium]
MIIKTLQVGMIGTNCYIVACSNTKEAAVIDPGDEAQRIMKTVKENGLSVSVIINTHGHWDHVGGNNELFQLTGVPVLIHEKDASFLAEEKLNLGTFIGKKSSSHMADQLLKEGDQVKVGNLSFSILHTPGHTPGGISIVGKNVVFVGDTLFAGSIGRTDLPGGGFDILIRSIKDKLFSLDDSYIVYPGHGPSTTIGWERKNNPFLI